MKATYVYLEAKQKKNFEKLIVDQTSQCCISSEVEGMQGKSETCHIGNTEATLSFQYSIFIFHILILSLLQLSQRSVVWFIY